MEPVYTPKGAAREYAPLALNLYRGCGHGCVYCYAPGCLRMRPEEFTRPSPRAGVIDALGKQVGKPGWEVNRDKTILLCFTTDPYQPLDEQAGLTRKALETLSGRAMVSVLTKGGKRAERDFDILRENNWELGCTLTLLDEQKASEWEPGAAPPEERKGTLLKARSAGIRIWVSIEPVLDVEEAIKIVRWTAQEGISTRLGRWNHDSRANGMDWQGLIDRALGIAVSNPGWELYIKDELARGKTIPAKHRVRPYG